jgi:hypothetical protein
MKRTVGDEKDVARRRALGNSVMLKLNGSLPYAEELRVPDAVQRNRRRARRLNALVHRNPLARRQPTSHDRSALGPVCSLMRGQCIEVEHLRGDEIRRSRSVSRGGRRIRTIRLPVLHERHGTTREAAGVKQSRISRSKP